MSEQKRIGVRLTRAEVRALLEFVTADKARTHICRVHFAPRLGEIVATDGHTLAVLRCNLRDEQFDAPAFNVDPIALSNAIKFTTRDCLEIEVTESEIVVGDLRLPSHSAPDADDTQFPPYRQILDACEFTGQVYGKGVGVNSFYLARLAAIGKALDGKTANVVLRPGAGELDPMRCELQSVTRGRTWIAVIMPVRL
jgi:hypothetical protein